MDFRSLLLHNCSRSRRRPTGGRFREEAETRRTHRKDQQMSIRSADLMTTYQLTTGRRLHALREIARRAMALAAAPVVAHATRAIAHDDGVLAMEAALEAANTNQHGAEAVALDKQVDRAVTGVELHLDAQGRVFGEEHQLGKDAALVRRELLPEGAGAITFLPFARQHERVGVMLKIAEQPGTEVAAAVQRIPTLPAMLAQVRALNDAYGDSLQDYDRGRPTREQVTQAQQEGQDMFAEVVAAILVEYAGQPERRADRDSLLEPVLRQNEAVRIARRRRRAPVDIDPGTGDELPGEQPGDDYVVLPAPGPAATRAR
jgi:hypothetical protein